MLCEWNSGEVPSEARCPTEGGGASGAPPTEIFKKVDCKWCNQSYSGALFVNKINQYFFFFFRIRSNSDFSGAVGSYDNSVRTFVARESMLLL